MSSDAVVFDNGGVLTTPTRREALVSNNQHETIGEIESLESLVDHV